MEQLRRLSRMLEVFPNGSLITLKQLNEGKLLQLDHKPQNMQVIVSGKDASWWMTLVISVKNWSK